MIFFSFIVYHLNASNISKLDLEAVEVMIVR